MTSGSPASSRTCRRPMWKVSPVGCSASPAPVDPAEERRDGRIVGQRPQPAGPGGAERLAGEGVDADVAGLGGPVAHPGQALTGAEQVLPLGGEDGVWRAALERGVGRPVARDGVREPGGHRRTGCLGGGCRRDRRRRLVGTGGAGRRHCGPPWSARGLADGSDPPAGVAPTAQGVASAARRSGGRRPATTGCAAIAHELSSLVASIGYGSTELRRRGRPPRRRGRRHGRDGRVGSDRRAATLRHDQRRWWRCRR